MPQYFVLVNWTDHGGTNTTETVWRAERVGQVIEQMR